MAAVDVLTTQQRPLSRSHGRFDLHRAAMRAPHRTVHTRQKPRPFQEILAEFRKLNTEEANRRLAAVETLARRAWLP